MKCPNCGKEMIKIADKTYQCPNVWKCGTIVKK